LATTLGWGIAWGIITGAGYGVLLVLVSTRAIDVVLAYLGGAYGAALGGIAGAAVGFVCGAALAVAHVIGALPTNDAMRYRRRLRFLLPSVAGSATAAASGTLLRATTASVFLAFGVGPTLVAFGLGLVRANQLSNRLNERSDP